MLGALWHSPSAMVLILAVVVTMASRLLAFAHGALRRAPAPGQLQDTLCAVAVVPPDCSAARLAGVLRWATHAKALRLHVFEYAATRSELPPSASLRHRLRPPREYDAHRAIGEALRSAYCDEAYVCVLPSNVSASAGWDATLVDMLARCPSRAAVLTTMLPAEHAQRAARGTYLRMELGGQTALTAASLLGDATAPVLQSFCCARFLFGRRSLATALLDVYESSPRACDLAVSHALWTRGFDFFAPEKPVLWSLRSCPVPGGARAKIELAPDGPVRSSHEYTAFSGVDLATGRVGARACLGLTANATAGEKSAKYGTYEDADELLATHPQRDNAGHVIPSRVEVAPAHGGGAPSRLSSNDAGGAVAAPGRA